MNNEEIQRKRGSFRYSYVSDTTHASSWNTLLEHLNSSTNDSISQSRNNVPTGGATPIVTTTSPTPPQFSITHTMVSTRSRYIGFKRCAQCRRFLMHFAINKDQEIYACDVCRIRVHESCLANLTTSCKMTTQFVGGLVESAVMRSNKKRWDPTTSPTSSSASFPQSPVSTSKPSEAHVHTMVPTTSESHHGSSANILEDEQDKKTWEDVTIKPEEIHHLKRVLEGGRFGPIHLAVYHGDVVVRNVNMSNVIDPERRSESFKAEVVTPYKNCRHDHIALFLGYYCDPLTDQYAIVTNFYANSSLYNRIHECPQEELELSWILQSSLQICQAMSYLHKRRIVHRDLRSKNILIDKSNKVVVTDFALMRMERLEFPTRSYGLAIPNHWIDYLAPELVGNLIIEDDRIVTNPDLPFSRQSDVYAFGTLFFELFMRKMPTGNVPWEIKIYEKVVGTKATICRITLATQRLDSKLTDLLLECWNFNPSARPPFSAVVQSLTSLIRTKETGRRMGAQENPLF